MVSRRPLGVEKLQILYGLSLEAALEDLSYRGDEPHRLAARTSARHDVMMICAKYAIETSRERDARRLVEEARATARREEPRTTGSVNGTGKFPAATAPLEKFDAGAGKIDAPKTTFSDGYSARRRDSSERKAQCFRATISLC